MQGKENQPDTVEHSQPEGPGEDQHARDVELNAYAIDRLAQAFETSARRWELIVYPSLFAFIILAAYGFYLVFSLAQDVHYLAVSVDSNMAVMASNMQAISDNISQMSTDVQAMAVGVESISQDIDVLKPMLASMEGVEQGVQSITFTTANMQGDMADMNRSIGRPMTFMNRFIPW